jgi:ABC-type transport system involved in cytochrome bd biosynthesis fused ATPase/permease subunit
MPSKKTVVENKGAGSAPGAITVTAQQSRFHLDAIDGRPPTCEINVKDLTIAIGQNEVLNRSELFLKEGGRYALVGRNGTGKSSTLSRYLQSNIHTLIVQSYTQSTSRW